MGELPEVAVRGLDFATTRFGQHARAVVQLTGLLPADVHVELLRADEEIPCCAWDRRMWSTQSYDNGCFVFEAPVDVADRRCHAWLVRVHDALDDRGPCAERRFELR